ncbi:hypothetical protein IWX81_002865 [Salinibacterium sp. CAN_S4]|uniref:hypothetical protein n=1 Tax=Salinibacterium sp. CAN_S4 TaxID=2787727 RepID=UPI0018EF6B21
MSGIENPGIYEAYRQTEAWPFLPFLGVLLCAGMIVFTLLLVMAAHAGAQPKWRAVVCGLATVIVGCASVYGLTVASAQWVARDEAKHTVYIASVREWITDQISVPVGNEETVQLLEGKTVKIATRDGSLTTKIQTDSSQDALILDY